MRRIRGQLSYANVMATLAVFIALGGTATAAVLVTGREIKDGSLTGRDLRDRSVGTRDLARSSVSGNRIKDGSLTARDLKDRTLGVRDLSLSLRARLEGDAGPQGARGAQGPAGPQGERGPGSAPLSTTAAAQANYASDATLVQLSLPSAGFYVSGAGVTLTNPSSTTTVNVAGCAILAEGNRQVGGGEGGTLAPGESRRFSALGATEITDVTQPMRAACNHDGTLDASTIKMFGLKLSD